jgi:hypothetical protein
VTGLKKKKEQLPPEPNMKCQGNVTVFWNAVQLHCWSHWSKICGD